MSESQYAPQPVDGVQLDRAAWPLAEPMGHAQKLAGIGRFANVIAHDFNNLLTVIRAYAEMALRERTLNADVREQLEAIRGAADSATWLSQQLLVHSRRNSGRASPVDLNLMIRDVHQLLGRSLPAGVTAELRLQESLPPILADPGPVGQVLLSALAHVMSGLPAGGRLMIESSERARAPRVPAPLPDTATHAEVTVRVSSTTPASGTEVANAGAASSRLSTRAPEHAGSTPLDDHGLSMATAADIVRSLQGAMHVTGDARQGWVIDIALPGLGAQSVPGAQGATIAGQTPVRALT